MKVSKISEDLIQQQDLYGAPPVIIKDNELIGGGMQVLYGVPSPTITDPTDIYTPVLYGPPTPTPTPTTNNTAGKTAVGLAGIFLSMILFIVGLIAMFSTKIPTFVKVIIGIFTLIVIAVIVALTVGIIKLI